MINMGTKRSGTDPMAGISTIELTTTSLPGPPVLKLRVKHQTVTQRLSLDIHESKNQKEKQRKIVDFSKSLNLANIAFEECDQLIKFLKELIKKETDYVLRSKAVELLGGICTITFSNKTQILEDILDSLHKENNHNVISKIFNTISTVATLVPNKTDIIQKVLKSAIKKLDDSHQDVRCACLKMIGRICPSEPIRISSTRMIDPLELFGEFSADQDPRVRAVVYQSLLTLHQRNHNLNMNIYEKACTALTDDYKQVRLAAVMLVWVFSHTLSDKLISQPFGQSVRLMDDAFIKICNMANDSEMIVRAEAVGLLGSMHNVSNFLLQQTLDKKLMSHGKKTKSFNERASERFQGVTNAVQGGSWSTGKTWGDATPSIPAASIDEPKLMNAGACGVFVRALEDEFMEVRSAGVDSLCELANQNPPFARNSTDFLVDMFNDEIEAVRLNSISSLIKLHEHVDFREDQLDTILECLNDCNQVVRDLVRELLAHSLLSTKDCLHATVLALLVNLKKYPQDKDSIWACMKELGQQHPYFVCAIIPEVLVSHSFYAVPEPSINNPCHIAVATLALNAAANYPSLVNLLPPYMPKHKEYMRDCLLHLLPNDDDSEVTAKRQSNGTDVAESAINNFFGASVLRMRKMFDSESPPTARTLQSYIEDFEHIQNKGHNISPAAEFMALFLRCQKVLIKCRQDHTWSIPAAFATTGCNSLQNDVTYLLETSYRMECLFCGLSSYNINTIKLIRILSHCLSVLLELRHISRIHRTKKIDLKLWGSLLQRLRKFKDHVTATTTIGADLQPVVDLQASIEDNLSQPSTLVDVLQNFFLTYPIGMSVENRLRRTSLRVIEPVTNIDAPLKFGAGLALCVTVHAAIENIADVSTVFVRIVYPDFKVQIHRPLPSDFQCSSYMKYKLVCKLLLSHNAWTEASAVRISVVKCHGTDIKKELSLNDGLGGTGDSMDFNYKGFLNLGEDVKVYIQPKSITR